MRYCPSQICAALIWSIAVVQPVLAVFSDDAYQVDYHYALLGIPQEQTTFFHQPSSTSRASLLYTLSEKSNLGAINPKDGALVWRHDLRPLADDAGAGYLAARDGSDTVVSAVGNGTVQGWDASDGRLVWSRDFKDDREVKGLDVLAFGEDGVNDVLVLSKKENGGIIVRRLKVRSGEIAWEHEISSELPVHVLSSTTNVFVVSLQGSKSSHKARVTVLDPVSGKQTDQYTLSTESEITGEESLFARGSGTASPILAWTDKTTKTLKVNLLGSKKIHSFDIKENAQGDVLRVNVLFPDQPSSLTHFLVHLETSHSHWAEVYHIDVGKSTVEHAYSLPQIEGRGAFSVSTQDANVYFVRHSDYEVFLVSSVSHGILGRWELTPEATALRPLKGSNPFHAVSEVVAKSDATYSVRSAVLQPSGEWVLVRNGELGWRRYESLSDAVAAEWIELNDAEDLAKELEVEGHESLVAAYVHRVKRHANDLRQLPDWLRGLPSRILHGFTKADATVVSQEGLHRDSFGLRKLVIVATENGHLHALDTGNSGKVIWSTQAAFLEPGETWQVRAIFADPSRGILIVKTASGGLVAVDTLTGKLRENSDSTPFGSRPVERAILLNNRIFDILEGGGLRDIVADAAPEPETVFVVQSGEGSLAGLKYTRGKDNVASATPVWEFSTAGHQQIVSISGRPAHDPVASIGRVLGDRSVMYKYLNENLLLVLTVDPSIDTATAHLLDSISGNVLYSTTHEGVDTSRRIASVLSENWFAYSLYGQIDNVNDTTSDSKSRGYQLVTGDIFESDLPNDRGPLREELTYSSTHPSEADNAPARPYVASQSWYLASEIESLAVSATRQGITSRSLLAYLPSSNAIAAIPRFIFDPRRPAGRDPTSAEQEEGLSRYTPVIELDPKWIITHQREVSSVHKILTSPTLLESTSLVFAYGLDIFGTRVAPSQAFDVLGKGFAKTQLLLTVVGLWIGVIVLGPVVRRKQTNSRWSVS